MRLASHNLRGNSVIGEYAVFTMVMSFLRQAKVANLLQLYMQRLGG